MSAALRGALLLVWLLWVVGCSAGPTATLAPPSSPTPVVIIPTRTRVPLATSTATAAASATAVPDDPTATARPAQASATVAATATATPDPALAAIYGYLEARARASSNDTAALACQAWIGSARTEAVSFASMKASMEDLVCSVVGISAPFTLVNCTGKLITTYGADVRERDLSHFVYKVVAEEGVWKMCGYN